MMNNGLYQEPITHTGLHVINYGPLFPVADPDLELRGGGGGGLDLLAMAAIFPSVISSFLPKIRGGGPRAPRAPPLDPSLISKDVVRVFIRSRVLGTGIRLLRKEYPAT